MPKKKMSDAEQVEALIPPFVTTDYERLQWLAQFEFECARAADDQ